MYSDKKTKDKIDLPHRLELSLAMLGFNQGLIQFADSKANGLVVVNSIFLASLTPALDHLKTASLGLEVALAASALVSVSALLASLMVMLSRGADTGEPRPKSLLYHKHILSFTKAQSFVDEFREADGEKVLEAFLFSIYDLAAIANAKFRAYKTAEPLTLVGAVLWIAAMAVQVA